MRQEPRLSRIIQQRIAPIAHRRRATILARITDHEVVITGEQPEPEDLPATRYHPERFPDVRETRDFINDLALLDQETAASNTRPEIPKPTAAPAS